MDAVALLFAMTIPGLVLGLLVLAAGERVVERVRAARAGTPRRRRPAAAAGFDVLSVVFDPARQHELERQRVEAQWREDDEQGAPPRNRVDLDSGVAHLRIPPPRNN